VIERDGGTTVETLAKQNAAPKILNVCRARNVQLMTFIEVLRAEGFRI
jgi:hypothetical protein